MREIDALATVVGLACQTNCRWGDEQRALIDTALRVDTERAKLTSMNLEHARPPELVAMVLETYEVPDGSRPVGLTSPQRKALERLQAKWEICARCDKPRGLHVEDDRCPR